MAIDFLTLALAKAFTKKTADALGAVKGAPCTIKSITAIDGGHRVTFGWTDKNGTEHTDTMDVMNGAPGATGEKGDTGEKGADGVKGDKGDDGYSPTITVTEITGGHRVTVTDAEGSKSFDVMDGQGGSGGDAKAFIAEYNVTTAQEINAFIDSNKEPFAPILIKRGNDYYTAITAQKQAENKVILRSFASLSGDYYVFMYTITDDSWAASNYPFQKKGDAYTKAETDALLANKAAQSSVVALQKTAEDLRLANEATQAELTQFKDDYVIDMASKQTMAVINWQYDFLYSELLEMLKCGGAVIEWGNQTYMPVVGFEDTVVEGTRTINAFVNNTASIDGITSLWFTWTVADADKETVKMTPNSSFHSVTAVGVPWVAAQLADKQDKLVYVVDKPEGTSPASGSVVQVGSFVDTDGAEYGIYEFYYRTSALPAADATKVYPLTPLLDDYTILDFVDATGVTENGHFVGSGRTDGANRIIVQQFSKNNKAFTMRAYGDYTQYTALVKIKFIGTKNV